MSGLHQGLSPGGYLYSSSNLEEVWSSGLERPKWIKNASKIYVVAYPSDWTSSHFLVDTTKPKVHSLGAGYGIFVEPKKVSRTKFWKDRDSPPTLFTVEGGGPAPGLTERKGVEWGINGMLVRFLIDSKDGPGQVGEVRDALARVAGHARAGDEAWLKDALSTLADAGLIKFFYVQEFINVVREAVRGQLGKGASWDHVTTINYEDHIREQQVFH